MLQMYKVRHEMCISADCTSVEIDQLLHEIFVLSLDETGSSCLAVGDISSKPMSWRALAWAAFFYFLQPTPSENADPAASDK